MREYVPSGQSMHALPSVVNLPFEHEPHTEAPVAGVYVLAGHARQIEPLLEKVPSGQSMHAFPSVVNLPFEHEPHTEAPDVGVYVLAGQGRQTEPFLE